MTWNNPVLTQHSMCIPYGKHQGSCPSTSDISAAQMRRRPKSSRCWDWLNPIEWSAEPLGIFQTLTSSILFFHSSTLIHSVPLLQLWIAMNCSRFSRVALFEIAISASMSGAKTLRKTAAKKAMQSMGIGNSKASSSTDAPPTITNIYRNTAGEFLVRKGTRGHLVSFGILSGNHCRSLSHRTSGDKWRALQEEPWRDVTRTVNLTSLDIFMVSQCGAQVLWSQCHSLRQGDFMKQAGVTVKSKGYWNAALHRWVRVSSSSTGSGCWLKRFHSWNKLLNIDEHRTYYACWLVPLKTQ